MQDLQTEEDSIATVQDLVEHLEKSFKPEDKLCYVDFVEGLKQHCVYINKDELGKMFFKRVSSFSDPDELCKFVGKDDVVVC